MTIDHDVLIVGGGLNGPVLALALAGAGLSVAVIDVRPASARGLPGFDGRAYALALASRRLLAAVGVWSRLAPDAQPILRVAAAQGHAGQGADPFRLIFDSAEIEEGAVGHMVEDRHLHAALVEAMRNAAPAPAGRDLPGSAGSGSAGSGTAASRHGAARHGAPPTSGAGADTDTGAGAAPGNRHGAGPGGLSEHGAASAPGSARPRDPHPDPGRRDGSTGATPGPGSDLPPRPAPGITHLAGVSVIAQTAEAGRIAVTLSDGRRLSGRLLVGADGRTSGTAGRAGIARQGWSYGQTALVAAVDHERPHGGTAWQFFMPSGPLAILPLPGNRSSIVWSETDATARAIADLGDEAFLDLLRPRFGDFLGGIALAGPRFSYPLGLSLAERYVAPQLALVGDAAHGVHPLAGQGLNLGLRDVAALAEVIVDARRRGEDIGAAGVLGRYQAWRRFDATAMGLGMDAVNRLFSNDNAVLAAARGLGMGVVGAIAPLRRALMRQAAGLSIDPMPRLLAGQPL